MVKVNFLKSFIILAFILTHPSSCIKSSNVTSVCTLLKAAKITKILRIIYFLSDTVVISCKQVVENQLTNLTFSVRILFDRQRRGSKAEGCY